jgi:hypothetical protein
MAGDFIIAGHIAMIEPDKVNHCFQTLFHYKGKAAGG